MPLQIQRDSCWIVQLIGVQSNTVTHTSCERFRSSLRCCEMCAAVRASIAGLSFAACTRPAIAPVFLGVAPRRRAPRDPFASAATLDAVRARGLASLGEERSRLRRGRVYA